MATPPSASCCRCRCHSASCCCPSNHWPHCSTSHHCHPSCRCSSCRCHSNCCCCSSYRFANCRFASCSVAHVAHVAQARSELQERCSGPSSPASEPWPSCFHRILQELILAKERSERSCRHRHRALSCYGNALSLPLPNLTSQEGHGMAWARASMGSHQMLCAPVQCERLAIPGRELAFDSGI